MAAGPARTGGWALRHNRIGFSGLVHAAMGSGHEEPFLAVRLRFSNVSVTTYANGDKAFVHSVDKSVPGGSTGKWTYTGGTGKLQGIKGQGISKCRVKSPEPGAEYTCDLTGSYKIASPKKKKT